MLHDTYGNILIGVAAVLTQVAGFVGLFLAWRKEMRNQNHFIDVSVRKLNGTASAIIHSMPVPAWLKLAVSRPDGTVEFRLQEMNDSCARKYGIDRLTYMGKTDLEAGWSKDVAEDFYQQDLLVWTTGLPTTTTEVINGVPTRVCRIRVQSQEGQVKGIFAYVIDLPCTLCELNPGRCPCPQRAAEKREATRLLAEHRQ